MALVFRIMVNKKSVTYCQQVLFIVKVFCVHKVLIALFIEYPLCFLLCHNLRLHMLKTCSIGKTVLSVSCARFKSHICKLRHPPPPTLRPRNPCICPCLSCRWRSAQISRLCPISFSSAGGANACAGVLFDGLPSYLHKQNARERLSGLEFARWSDRKGPVHRPKHRKRDRPTLSAR